MDKLKELRQLMINKGTKINGKNFNWIVDPKEIMLSPRGLFLISELFHEKLKTFNSKSVGGIL